MDTGYYDSYNLIDPNFIGIHEPKPISRLESTLSKALEKTETSTEKNFPKLNIIPFDATPNLDLRIYWTGLDINNTEQSDLNRMRIGFDAHFESPAEVISVLILLGRVPEINEAYKLKQMFEDAKSHYEFDRSRIGILYPKDEFLQLKIPFMGSVWNMVEKQSQNLHKNMHSFKDGTSAINWVRDGKLPEQ